MNNTSRCIENTNQMMVLMGVSLLRVRVLTGAIKYPVGIKLSTKTSSLLPLGLAQTIIKSAASIQDPTPMPNHAFATEEPPNLVKFVLGAEERRATCETFNMRSPWNTSLLELGFSIFHNMVKA
jgi:hypothetical protein